MASEQPSHKDEAHTCPTCGGPMQAWPALDGPGHIWLCPRCPAGQPGHTASPELSTGPEPPPSPPTPATGVGTGRLRDLIKPSAERVPDSLLEDLPEEARRALAGARPARPGPSPVDHQEGLVESLRRQGYVITEDSRGVRLGGNLSPRFARSSELRPSDIIRLAADMDGGVLPPEKRVRCPKCDAVVPVGSPRCQWCGTALPPAPGTE